MEISHTCPYCGAGTDLNINFCPNCGHLLKAKLLSTTFLTQLGIYLLSFILPPFGLWPAIKYLRQGDSKAKSIGITAIVLTVASIIITVWTLNVYVTAITRAVNSEMQQYQVPGFESL